jgi:hypothetical protein
MNNKDTAFKINLRLTITVTVQPPATAARPIVRTPVESKSVASIGYDPTTRSLDVQYKSSSTVYRYADVPSSVYAELMSFQSKGTYMAWYVKPRYTVTKVADAR